MLPILSSNKSGFTLIEVMVAMVIMLIGLLGLLQSVNLASEVNLKNHLRDEATRVAESIMNDMITGPFERNYNNFTTVPSRVRNSAKGYSVRRTNADLSTSKEYQVDVRWKYKNYSATHSIVSVRGAP